MAGLLLASLDSFPGEPDVVMVRGYTGDASGGHACCPGAWTDLVGGTREATGAVGAIPIAGRRADRARARALSAAATGSWLPWPASRRWQALTQLALSQHGPSLPALRPSSPARWPTCRSAATRPSYPCSAGQVNVSFFCTGGITWGRNQPRPLDLRLALAPVPPASIAFDSQHRSPVSSIPKT